MIWYGYSPVIFPHVLSMHYCCGVYLQMGLLLTNCIVMGFLCFFNKRCFQIQSYIIVSLLGHKKCLFWVIFSKEGRHFKENCINLLNYFYWLGFFFNEKINPFDWWCRGRRTFGWQSFGVCTVYKMADLKMMSASIWKCKIQQ